MAGYSSLYPSDVEAGLFGGDKPDYSFQFAEREVRQGFLRKVFGLLTVQLAITAGVTAAFCLSPPLKSYVLASPWTFWVAFLASLGLVIALSCSESLRRSHPTNLIALLVFTGCESVLVGMISAMYDTQVVLLAALMTVGITGCLTLYALQTKRDFTASGGILFSLLFALITAGLLSIFFHSRVMNIAISGLGAALFSAYIVYDVQAMVGGGEYALSPDEYVMAAIMVYLDVINIFLYLLRLLQEMQSNN